MTKFREGIWWYLLMAFGILTAHSWGSRHTGFFANVAQILSGVVICILLLEYQERQKAKRVLRDMEAEHDRNLDGVFDRRS